MRRTKEQIEKDKKDSVISEIKKLIKLYGEQTGEFWIWNKYPICIKDVCVDTVGLDKNNTLLFGNFAEGRNIFLKIIHSENDLNSRWLSEFLTDFKHMIHI